jgi:mRNA interferase MazF
MPFEFGDVVPVPFPFTDRSASKKRPAVVVSKRTYNAARPDGVLIAETLG